MLFILAQLAILLADIGILWIIVKLYTEILKIGHIQGIGRR